MTRTPAVEQGLHDRRRGGVRIADDRRIDLVRVLLDVEHLENGVDTMLRVEVDQPQAGLGARRDRPEREDGVLLDEPCRDRPGEPGGARDQDARIISHERPPRPALRALQDLVARRGGLLLGEGAVLGAEGEAQGERVLALADAFAAVEVEDANVSQQRRSARPSRGRDHGLRGDRVVDTTARSCVTGGNAGERLRTAAGRASRRAGRRRRARGSRRDRRGRSSPRSAGAARRRRRSRRPPSRTVAPRPGCR